jgi:RNA polymerase sigma factor (sigma-70 family)
VFAERVTISFVDGLKGVSASAASGLDLLQVTESRQVPAHDAPSRGQAHVRTLSAADRASGPSGSRRPDALSTPNVTFQRNIYVLNAKKCPQAPRTCWNPAYSENVSAPHLCKGAHTEGDMEQVDFALGVGTPEPAIEETSYGQGLVAPALASESFTPPVRSGPWIDATLDKEAEEVLLRQSSGGSLYAMTQLYEQHWDAGVSFAYSLTRDLNEAEDIASLAFLKVFSASRNGKGPDGPLRPYLYRTIRTCLADHWRRRSYEYAVDQLPETGSEDPSFNLVENAEDRELASKALQSLPKRWQEVIWHADVVGLRPREIAPLLEIEANAVSALLRRARRGLREAYLVEYLRSTSPDECHELLPLLARAVMDSASARDLLTIRRHTRNCQDCRRAMGRLHGIHSSMRSVAVPLSLGALIATQFSHCSETGCRVLQDLTQSPLMVAITEKIDEAMAQKSSIAKTIVSSAVAFARFWGAKIGTEV